MPVDPDVRNLLTCVLLNLDARIVDKRAAIQSALVEASLFRIGHPADQEEISQELDRLVVQKSFLGSDELAHMMDDCQRRATITPIDGRFALAERTVETFKRAFAESDAVFRRVRDALIERIDLETLQPLDQSTGDALFSDLRQFLTERVYESSIQLARKTTSIDDIVVGFDAVDPVKRLDALVERYFPPERMLLRSQVRNAILDYVRSTPPDLLSMLKLIHHNVLVNQILCLDPGIVALYKAWFSRRRLYLDTNVVLASLCPSHRLHHVVEEVLTSSLRLGAQLFISPITKQELQAQVDRAKLNFRRMDRDPLIKRFAEHGDDAILSTFLALRRKQRSLDWDSFLAPFLTLDELLMERGILVEEEGFAEALASPLLPEIRRAVKDAKPGYATDAVIDHDATNCALVLHLRRGRPADERGQVVWLLTIDRTLRKSQRILWRAHKIEAPYCMHIADWGEIALPAQNLLDFVFADFVSYLAQARLGAVADPQIVQLDFLETITDAEVDVDALLRLQVGQVRAAITALQANRDARSLALLASRSEDPRERDESRGQLQLLINEAVEESDPLSHVRADYDRKLALLAERMSSKDADIASLEERLSRVQSNWGFRLAAWIDRIFRRRDFKSGGTSLGA